MTKVPAINRIKVELQDRLTDVEHVAVLEDTHGFNLRDEINRQRLDFFRQACVLAVDSGQNVTLCDPPWPGTKEPVEICTITPNLHLIWRTP